MMYLILCVGGAALFLIFLIWSIVLKSGKRAVALVFSLLFLAASAFCGYSYYKGKGTKPPKEIAEYCGGSLDELVNATKLDFKNTSEDIYEADGVSVCLRDGKIIYVDLTSEKYMLHGFSGKFSRENTFYKGEETAKTLKAVLEETGFSEFSAEYAGIEFIDGNESDVYAYDTKGRTFDFSFDENGTGKNIRYFPDPKFTENLVRSAEAFSENVSEFLNDSGKLNLIEKEEEFKSECGKRVTWQLKTVETAEDFILAERDGTEFKIYPLPQYLSNLNMPEKDEYFEVVGLFDGYADAWTVRCAVTDKTITVSKNDITGTYKNKSSSITIKDEGGKLHLTGTSNYGAYTADGYVKKINDTTYFYEGKEGDFYITLEGEKLKITTDTLKSFEGEYTPGE